MTGGAAARRWLRPGWLLIVAGAVILAIVALRVPLATLLSVGVLLLCPLLMMSMHGGHGEHGGHGGHAGSHDQADHGRLDHSSGAFGATGSDVDPSAPDRLEGGPG